MDHHNLIEAILSDDKKRVYDLLDRGVSADKKGSGGFTAVIATAFNKDPILCESVILKSKRPNQSDNLNWSAVMYSSYNCNHPVTSKMLSNNLKSSSEAISIALDNKDEATVNMHLKYKASPNNINARGEIIIHKAACLGNYNIMENMLKNGGDPNIQDSDGNTPAIKATWHGHVNMVELLSLHKADFKIKNSDGKDVSYYADLYMKKGISNIVDDKSKSEGIVL